MSFASVKKKKRKRGGEKEKKKKKADSPLFYPRNGFVLFYFFDLQQKAAGPRSASACGVC